MIARMVTVRMVTARMETVRMVTVRMVTARMVTARMMTTTGTTTMVTGTMITSGVRGARMTIGDNGPAHHVTDKRVTRRKKPSLDTSMVYFVLL